MRLSERLMMSLLMVPKGAKVADIGCDHGKSSIWLVQNKISEKQIAMDLREGPLDHARENIAYFGLQEKIECRLSDGIKKLAPGEADTLLICGMGGMLTIEILTARPDVLEKVNTLVLQPQSDIGKVRRFIMERGFVITEERACRETGKFYNAMKAERKSTCGEAPENGYGTEHDPYTYSDADYEFGRLLLQRRDPVLKEFLDHEYNKAKRVLARLKDEDTENSRLRADEYRNIIKVFEDALSKYTKSDL